MAVQPVWLNLSNRVNTKTLFVLSVVLWFIPWARASELIFWLVYKGGSSFVVNNRNWLPKTYIEEYQKASLICLKMELVGS